MLLGSESLRKEDKGLLSVVMAFIKNKSAKGAHIRWSGLQEFVPNLTSVKLSL